jgi:hypothetical protein
MHDDEIRFQKSIFLKVQAFFRRRLLFKVAKSIFPVSELLFDQIPLQYRSKASILPPISRDYNLDRNKLLSGAISVSEKNLKTRLVYDLAYAGKIYPPMLDEVRQLLKKFRSKGLRLLVISDIKASQIDPLAEYSDSLLVLPYFSSPSQSLAFILENAKIVWVCSPIVLLGQWRMLLSSFPSKLVEYAVNGVPFVITAGRGSALHLWGMRNHKSMTFSDSYYEALSSWLMALTESELLRFVDHSFDLGATLFDPKRLTSFFFHQVTGSPLSGS